MAYRRRYVSRSRPARRGRRARVRVATGRTRRRTSMGRRRAPKSRTIRLVLTGTGARIARRGRTY